MKLDAARGDADRRCDHQTVGLTGDPGGCAAERRDRQRLGVGGQIGDRDHDRLAPEHVDRLGRADRFLVDVDRDASAGAETTRVDHGVADHDVAVLALGRRVQAVREAGRPDHVDEGAVRTVRAQVDGDRLAVAGLQEPVVGDRRRFRARPHVDAQHCGVGEFTVAHLVGDDGGAGRARRGGEADGAVGVQRRRPERRVRAGHDRHRQRVAVGVAVVEQDRHRDRPAVDDVGAVVACVGRPVERLLDGERDRATSR